MQSNSQVVILGIISIFVKPEHTVEFNRLADQVRKNKPHPTLLLPPGLQTYSIHLQFSGRVQFKNRVDLV